MKKVLYIILIVLIIIFCLLLYSRFIGTIGLETNEIPYKTEYIAESYNGLKIVHFSDLHYKKIITEKRVRQLVDEIIRLKPDIVLFTGDLLDNDTELSNDNIDFLINQLSRIESTYGNFAVLGDKDYLKACKKMLKLSEENYTPAQIFIGDYYLKKNDIQNYEYWYVKAAENGDTTAQFELGLNYYKGKGLNQNYAKAIQWFTKVADGGNAD